MGRLRRRVRTDVRDLRQMHIKQRQPILKRLHGKAAQDEPYAKYSEPTLRKIVGVVLDEGIHRYSDASDDACHQSYTERERPGVVQVMDEHATDERRGRVPDGAHDGTPELAPGEPWLHSQYWGAYRENRQLPGQV
jgi:hypothetical protein